MDYYYYDLCVDIGDKMLQPFDNKEDFEESLLWNISIAKEYGDKVISGKKASKLIDSGEEFDIQANGAIFIACHDISTYCDGSYAE